MQKILFILIVVGFWAATTGCSDDDRGPDVSFRRPYYVLPASESLEVEVRLSEPAPTDLSVPFDVAGSGEEEVDYSISAREFVVKAGETSATVTITPVTNMTEGREIHLTLRDVVGYIPGIYRKTMIPIEIKSPFTSSFLSTEYNLYVETEVAALLHIGSREYTSPSYDISIPFDIDPSSTAELGTHYEIEGGVKQFIYRKDDNMARVNLKFLKKEAGKDKIVFRLVETDNFMISLSNNRAYITINGPVGFDDLVGSWKFEEFSSEDYVTSTASMAGDSEGVKNLPKCSASDILMFETSGGKNVIRTSGLTGDLINYFCDGAEVTVRDIVNEQIYLPAEMNEWDLHRSVLRTGFSKVNLNFSSTSQNYAAAEVDFRILGDGDILEVRIVQYIPTDFLQKTYADVSDPFYSGNDRNFDKNVPMKGNYTLSYKFSRVKD